MDEELTSRRSNLLFAVLTVVNLFLLTTHLNVYILVAKNVLFYLLHPTTAMSAQVLESSREISSTLQEIVTVHQDNRALRQSIQRYAYLDHDYQRMKQENDRLRQLAAFPASTLGEYVVARVVGREPSTWFQWVTIDKGVSDGLYMDAPALAWVDNRPAVLGRVIEVFAHSAKVVLVTNVLSAIPVQIKTLGEDGLLEGQNNASLKVNYLTPDRTITIGDEVVTSPLSAVFPEGIAIGRIQDVTAVSDSDMLRSATVRPAVNINSLREVIILKEPARKHHE